MAIKTTGKSEKQLFHNEWLNVYPQQIGFKEIKFWPKNHRTELAFDIIEAQKGKSISKLTLAEITDFLTSRSDLKLVPLARSIEKNGVRVPMIVLDDGTLLDGNRRYFACSYISIEAKKQGKPEPDVLSKIPVWAIKTKDISDRTKQKILAEANFVEDFKVPWPLDVKAKIIDDFYKSRIREGVDKKKVYEEILDVYAVEKDEVDAYLDTIKLTKEFVSSATEKSKNKFRQIVQEQFLYFWEFRNKALRGRSPLDPQNELPKVKGLFFEMMQLQRFKNFKQVEPMIKSIRDKHAWGLLASSKGSKIDVIEALFKEEKAVKSAEDKIRNFLTWLRDKANHKRFKNTTFTLLEKLATLCSKLLHKRNK
ncbi:MAG: hypothetical protein JW947_06620 [Sedimentisphaerales bacterium]|nr:hypothetical protein [Sedimentisphaerales bacterium]